MTNCLGCQLKPFLVLLGSAQKLVYWDGLIERFIEIGLLRLKFVSSVSSIIQHEKEYGLYNHSNKNIYNNVENTNFEWDKICPICKSKNVLINFDVAICTSCSARFVFGRFHTDVMELCRDHTDTHATKCNLPLYFITFDNQYLFCYCNECAYLCYID